METTEKTMDVLNDLIKINNDRTAGFEMAAEDLEGQDQDLKSLFSKLAYESRNNVTELSAIVNQNDSEAETDTSFSGDLHRAWLGVKATFTGHDRESILEECERGEDAIKDAYRSAIGHDPELAPEIIQIISRQQEGINASHDLIKSLRDNISESDVTDENEPEAKNDFEPVNENGFKTNGEADFESGYDEDFEPNKSNGFLASNETGEAAGTINEYGVDDEDNFRAEGEPYTEPVVENDREWADGEFKTPAMNSKLKEFFIDQLEDLLWAENKLIKTLPKMQEAATSVQLKEAFSGHLVQTQTHVSRLEQVFGIIGEDVDTKKCAAMAGIVDEGEDIIDETEEGTAQRDVGLIFAGQKVEHYEIATYGGMVSLAKTLGYQDAADLLSQTLEEEKQADEVLSQIAENNVNYLASTEPQEETSSIF